MAACIVASRLFLFFLMNLCGGLSLRGVLKKGIVF